MTIDIQRKPPKERFAHLLSVMKSKRFLNKEGLGNEVPFFICPFSPSESVEMSKMQKHLVNQLERQGVRILEINLYDLSVALLHQRGVWNRVLEVEEEITKDEFKDLLQGVLDPEKHLIPAIAQKMSETEFDILFITGVGEVFPYIRSHNVLNNLQRAAKERPSVMFFPGAYTHSLAEGASLDLFSPLGQLHDDKYYRAFNIFDYDI